MKKITARATLSVMTDNYADHILSAIGQVDTKNVAVQTDALGTTFTGEQDAVFSAVYALFHAANDGKTHLNMHIQLSANSPTKTTNL